MSEIPKIRKVHLNTLIEILVELYNKGVDYIDIMNVTNSDVQDGVGISFCKEYMNKEMMDNFDKISEITRKIEDKKEEVIRKKDIKLSDEDLNQLL